MLFHNKGMDKIDLPRILNGKRVISAVPKHLSGPLPVVSYTYTKTIAGKIFNHRKVVEQMKMDDIWNAIAIHQIISMKPVVTLLLVI